MKKPQWLKYRAWAAALLLLLAVLLPHHHHAVGEACYAIAECVANADEGECHPGHADKRPVERRNECHLQMVGQAQAKIQRTDAPAPLPPLMPAMPGEEVAEPTALSVFSLSGTTWPAWPAVLPLSAACGLHTRRGPPAVYES